MGKLMLSMRGRFLILKPYHLNRQVDFYLVQKGCGMLNPVHQFDSPAGHNAMMPNASEEENNLVLDPWGNPCSPSLAWPRNSTKLVVTYFSSDSQG